METTSKKYKKELLEKVFVKNDEKAKAKYNEIITELEKAADEGNEKAADEGNEKAADEGNEKAEKELDLWDDAKFDLIRDKIKAMSPESEAVANAFINKKGKGW